jgi:nicotinamide-nucleotide amidase
VRAAVLLVGDELLGGVISDRNAAEVARALGPRGGGVTRIETVGDEAGAIADALRRLAADQDLVVVCGGLGPTEDDLTRDGVARALGVPLREDDALRRELTARLAGRGPGAEAAAARQSAFPEGTMPVANAVGSAPGFQGRWKDCAVWVVPGVPAEAREMVRALAARLPAPPGDHEWERLVATAGVGETRVAGRLEAAGFHAPEGVRLAYLPSPGGVRLRLFAPEGAPRASFDAAEARLRALLGADALPERSLAESLVAAARAAGSTLATAESCTGGLVGARITDVPGASSVYLGGIVTYADHVKTERLGVPADVIRRHGAVSEPVCAAMADGVRRALGVGLAVSVTGIAGPSGGTADKPVGTVWIGVADGGGTEARRFRFPGPRDMVRERSVNKALEMAYRRLVGAPG